MSRCAEWVQRGSLGSGADRLVHYPNCSKRLYCKDGRQFNYAQGTTPNVNACDSGGGSNPPPPPPSGCAEWVQRGNLGAGADRLVHYKNCSKRLYCTNGQQFNYPQGTTPNVNACPSGGSPPSGGGSDKITCNRVTNSEWFCNFKFPSSKKFDSETTEASLQACQSRCFKNTGCGGWSIRQKDGACRLYKTSGTWPYKDQMVSATGWVGGPRWDTTQGNPSGIGSGDDTSDTSDTTETTDTSTTTTDTRSALQKAWDEHKALIIIGILLIVFVSIGMSSASLILVM
jgi:hypothetical protein